MGVSQPAAKFLGRLAGGTYRGQFGFGEPSLTMVENFDDCGPSWLSSSEPR